MSHILIVRLTLLLVGFVFGLSFSAGFIFLFHRHPFIRGQFVVPFPKYKDEKDG